MQINEVTLFKLMIFVMLVVITTIFVLKIGIFKSSTDGCELLITEPEVEASVIAPSCPEGFYPNFGKLADVPEGNRCCVKYG